MPILNVRISGEPNPETTKSVSALLVKLTARILRKQPDVTAVAIDYVPEGQCFVGAETWTSKGSAAFTSTSK
jgi:4-oxalocrotonate tautomerase